MTAGPACTIVIPTRDDPAACGRLLETLALETACERIEIHVLFLANDTREGDTEKLRNICGVAGFALLQPRVIAAMRNYPTAEENIRYTLGSHLVEVDDYFLIIGNTDSVKLGALSDAVEFMCEQQLELLLIGIMNQETCRGKLMRQLYSTPRHLNPKNRLGVQNCVGSNIYEAAMSDYGPVDYLAFIGCQIYTKEFFREKSEIEKIFADQLYSHAMATLELTSRRDCALGFFPQVVVERVKDLDDRVNGPARYKMAQGLSSHILLSILTNSLPLSDVAFHTLVNAQSVAVPTGASIYTFSNVLYLLVHQMSSYVAISGGTMHARYSAGELRDIVAFGRRLGSVDIGLPAAQCAMISTWLQHFSVIGSYADAVRINDLLAGASPVLALLDTRPGMDRWTVRMG